MIARYLLAVGLFILPTSVASSSDVFNNCFFNQQEIQCKFKQINKVGERRIAAYEIVWADGKSNIYRAIPGGQSNIKYASTYQSEKYPGGSLYIQDKPRLTDEQGGLWLMACLWGGNYRNNWKAIYNPENDNLIRFEHISSDCEGLEGGFGPI